MTDHALIEKIVAGDDDAFRMLVEQQQTRVLNVSYAFTKNREDAEDVTQEVFIEVHRSLSKFRGESKLSTWIYQIAVSKSLDFLRKNKRKDRWLQITHLFSTFREEDDVIHAPETARPDVDTEARERRDILLQTIDSLAESQKIAITLSKLQGFSYQEAADIMNTSVSAVESLLYRAQKNLHKKLYDYYKTHM